MGFKKYWSVHLSPCVTQYDLDGDCRRDHRYKEPSLHHLYSRSDNYNHPTPQVDQGESNNVFVLPIAFPNIPPSLSASQTLYKVSLGDRRNYNLTWETGMLIPLPRHNSAEPCVALASRRLPEIFSTNGLFELVIEPNETVSVCDPQTPEGIELLLLREALSHSFYGDYLSETCLDNDGSGQVEMTIWYVKKRSFKCPPYIRFQGTSDAQIIRMILGDFV
ncbi:hypothetical protein TREMEDRAFT_64091 [Tremella mesenterica DSM 1558]|uniref:uncharacterized protein n=1 Tax=Tremella mesenterica (strain ATCC 24925 / CBS 8224 / DSM 1558 / NBRC 9311 / NRRL Y-6157 / RJB 2259-6 / UBC 559-6) TaxID=578456 RepID=UPI0003F498DF|nr:uncharacterized protein TREMEDRAFT_64091 [Tremella mesenterica DSM 1558]EIW67511.1 hypothetical protein TREMEDRAFT_64091 [Tremella mesenterica DSM 1558]